MYKVGLNLCVDHAGFTRKWFVRDRWNPGGPGCGSWGTPDLYSLITIKVPQDVCQCSSKAVGGKPSFSFTGLRFSDLKEKQIFLPVLLKVWFTFCSVSLSCWLIFISESMQTLSEGAVAKKLFLKGEPSDPLLDRGETTKKKFYVPIEMDRTNWFSPGS